MTRDMFIPTFDAEGNPAGVFDMAGLFDASHEATRSAIFNLDADRGEMIHGAMQAVKGVSKDSQAIILAGTIADLLETFQGIADVAEAYGVPARSKLREIWGGDPS